MERRPLVLVNGELRELPTGDTLPGGGAATSIGPVYVEKTAGTLVLSPSDPSYQVFTGAVVGQNVELPAAASCPEGKFFFVANAGPSDINVYTESIGFSLYETASVRLVRGFASDGTTPAWYVEPIKADVMIEPEIDRIYAYSSVDDTAPLTVFPMATPNEAAFSDGSFWTTDTAAKVKVGGVVYNLLSGSGGLTVATVEIDFGATPVRYKQFAIADAGVSAGSRIWAMQSGNPAAGRDADENELTILHCRAYCSGTPADEFTLWVDCLNGTVSGKHLIDYFIQPAA